VLAVIVQGGGGGVLANPERRLTAWRSARAALAGLLAVVFLGQQAGLGASPPPRRRR